MFVRSLGAKDQRIRTLSIRLATHGSDNRLVRRSHGILERGGRHVRFLFLFRMGLPLGIRRRVVRVASQAARQRRPSFFGRYRLGRVEANHLHRLASNVLRLLAIRRHAIKCVVDHDCLVMIEVRRKHG